MSPEEIDAIVRRAVDALEDTNLGEPLLSPQHVIELIEDLLAVVKRLKAESHTRDRQQSS